MSDNAEEDEGSEVSTSAELPPLSEFLLSAADLLSLRLSAKLVVVSIRHKHMQNGTFQNNTFLGELIPHTRPARLGHLRRFGCFG